MEFVTIRYSRRRTVLIDGEEGGFTNMRLRVNRGSHVFTLSDPPNFEPKQRRVRVQNTTAISPILLTFKRTET